MKHKVEYSPESRDHLKMLTKTERVTILDKVDAMLVDEPQVPTKNRKPMLPNPIATWELRIGALRVYYDIETSPHPVVRILAIGKKIRSEVHIGKEVVTL
jgi:mRNA-degrading endonuclease RelE of RelBE toxin-antitoxin system